MSLNTSSFSRVCSLLLLFVLILQPSVGQQSFPAIDLAIKRNQQALGRDVVMLVYRSGKIVYENNLGDMTSSTQERIASCSKWLTSTLVMTFIDEGKLSLEDTIGKYLPIFTKYGKGQIKIKQCLSLTTGLDQPPVRLVTLINRNNKYNTLEEEVDDFAKKNSKIAEPGSEFRYGNIGLNIAGHILEVISGKGFEELFQARIARPLNMGATTFAKNGEVPNPSGGAWSTASDYMNFLIMFLNKGIFKGKRIISKAGAEKMMEVETNPQMIRYAPAPAEGLDYGYGLWILEKDKNGKSSSVTCPGLFGTWPYVDFCRNYACIIFTKSLLTERKREIYDATKKVIDQHFPSICN